MTVTVKSRISMICLCVLMLSGCDALTVENVPEKPAQKQDSVSFHPLKELNVAAMLEHSVYVPVYSNIYISGGGQLNLSITLSIRNTDFKHPLVINKVSYYNTAGTLIEEYLDAPYVLEAMASTHFFITQADLRGGVGANFIVQWSADPGTNAAVVEAVMAGSKGTHGIAFINSGRDIKASQ